MLSRQRILLAIGSAVLGLTATACGGSNSNNAVGPATGAGAAGSATTLTGVRTVDVTMADIKFDTPSVDVKVGETVRFVFHNQGKLLHEAVIGASAAQDEHEKMMASMVGTMHDSADAVSVAPGKTNQLTYTFKTAGQLLIACHQPGHYAAGMKININVA